MEEEIFGPILPVLTYRSLDEADRPHSGAAPAAGPVPVYPQTRPRRDSVLGRLCFGGGCINDTVMHLATSRMPFGGVGESGMGGYHGKYGLRYLYPSEERSASAWPVRIVALRYAALWTEAQEAQTADVTYANRKATKPRNDVSAASPPF